MLHYLVRHRDLGLRYSADDSRLHGYTDSDWATRHSTSGAVFMYNQAAVSWSCKKQVSVALSSCEAEIMAASEAAKEASYLRSFLAELGAGDDKPTSLGMDKWTTKLVVISRILQPAASAITRARSI